MSAGLRGKAFATISRSTAFAKFNAGPHASLGRRPGRSQGAAGGVTRVASTDRRRIRHRVPPDFSQQTYSWANGEIAKAIQRARLPVNVAWEGYDSIEGGTLQRYGLFNTSGTEKLGMIHLRTALIEGAAEMAALPNPPGRIAGIVVSAVHQGQQVYDLFEVYGTFPSHPQNASEISLICNGQGVTAPDLEWVAANPSQVNFRIKHVDSATVRYCSVKFPGTWTHGPKKLWPGACLQPVCR